jgi:Caspase domain
MYHLLIEAFGFDPNEIWLYTDQSARSTHIQSALRHMLVQSQPGDVACFYYAGHGDLISGSDGKHYESIVPASGAPIADDLLHWLAAGLQQSVVNFTVILDSCHSGGMQNESEPGVTVRSNRLSDAHIETLRQTVRTRVPCGICLPPEATDVNNNVSNVRSSGVGGVCMDEDPDKIFVPLAKSTLIAACRFSETAGETVKHGYLTQSFINIVNKSGFQINHGDLLDQLRSQVHTLTVNQTPQLRGQQNRMAQPFLEAWNNSR